MKISYSKSSSDPFPSVPLRKSLSILLGGGLGLALVVGHKSSSPLGADNFTFSGEAFVGVALKFDVLGLKNTI